MDKGSISTAISLLLVLIVILAFFFVFVTPAKGVGTSIKLLVLGPDSLPDDERMVFVFGKFVDFLESPKSQDFTKFIPENAPCIAARFEYGEYFNLPDYYILLKYEGPRDGKIGDIAYRATLFKKNDKGEYAERASVLLGKMSYYYVSATPYLKERIGTTYDFWPKQQLSDFTNDKLAPTYIYNPNGPDSATFEETAINYTFAKYPTLFLFKATVVGYNGYYHQLIPPDPPTIHSEPRYAFDPIGFKTTEKDHSLTDAIRPNTWPTCTYKKV